jgi:multiple sugar transport system substrate-binding protein
MVVQQPIFPRRKSGSAAAFRDCKRQKEEKRMKRKGFALAVLMVFALSVPALWAAAQEESAEQQVEFWGFYDLTDTEDPRAVFMAEAIAGFQEDTGITVVYEQVAWDQMDNKVTLVARSGGDMPDVVQGAAENVPGWINAGALLDIMGPVSRLSWYDELDQFEKDMFEVGNSRYAVGLFISGGNFYFDLPSFPNGLPESAEQWLAEGARLKREGKYALTGFMGKGSGGAAVVQGYAPLFWSNGGRLFDDEGKPAWATAENVEVVEWVREMFTRGYMPEAAFTGDWTASEIPFTSGNAGAVRGGSWSFLYMDGLQERYDRGEVTIAPPPSFGEQGYVFANSETFAVPKGAKNADNAIAFIDYFVKDSKRLAGWANSQFGMPTTATAQEDEMFSNDFYVDTAHNLFTYGHISETSPYYNECTDALATALQELIINPRMDIMSTLKDVETQMLRLYW